LINYKGERVYEITNFTECDILKYFDFFAEPQNYNLFVWGKNVLEIFIQQISIIIFNVR